MSTILFIVSGLFLLWLAGRLWSALIRATLWGSWPGED